MGKLNTDLSVNKKKNSKSGTNSASKRLFFLYNSTIEFNRRGYY